MTSCYGLAEHQVPFVTSQVPKFKKRIELERGCCADITVNMSISGFGEIPRVLLVNIPKKESHSFLLRIIQLFIFLFENPKNTTRGNI